MTSDELRKTSQQHLPETLSVLQNLTDDEIVKSATHARIWLLGMLNCHDQVLSREHEMRMFRSAVEKEMAGKHSDWSEKERLYMALTDYSLATPEERLKSTIALVLRLNLAEKLKDVSKLATIQTDRIYHASRLDVDVDDTREQIVAKVRHIKVDHFACAIPLSSLTTDASTSVIDDNAGCCPICQNSYTDTASFPIEDLLADYPVRIKHCGHVVGKACLEQWMITPKIEAAKYPHRTCPLCRTKIEGVKAPTMPDALKQHVKFDRRAMETVRELVYGWDLELEECFEAIVACMSEEIACEEVLAEMARHKSGENDSKSDEGKKEVLDNKLNELKQNKRAWGFRGDGIWRGMRDEWMHSGVARKE